MKKKIINKNDESHASSILKKFYDEGLIPAEKKPYLTKLSFGEGPYLAVESDQGEAHYLLDAASQIATLGHGFNPSTFFGTSHHKAAWTNNPYDSSFLELLDSYRHFFERKLKRQKIEINITNSGAEANELAIGLAYAQRAHKKANKIMAFEGSFHGRMLLSLYSTWNPVKREPFQWQGHETTFVKYPEINDDQIRREFPDHWLSYWESGDFLEPSAKPQQSWLDNSLDRELKEEVKSLWAIRDEFLKGEIFTLLIEPMQCEGGDRYSSDRFHTALLLMAKQFGVKVIYDEVQTGFHLGREFFWHQQFELKDSKNKQIAPDYIVCAKKAQVGLVIFDRTNNPPQLNYSEQQFQVASVIRGYIHALGLDQLQASILEKEEIARKELHKLTKDYDQYISRPRAMGLCFAFEVNDQEKVNEFIKLRFEHGLLFYPAGAKTLRFRLNTAFSAEDIQFLFNQLRNIIKRIFQNEKVELPTLKVGSAKETYNGWSKWHKQMVAMKTEHSSIQAQDFIKTELESFSKKFGTNLKLIQINAQNFEQYKSKIIDIEKASYEPTRQTDISYFEKTAHDKNSVCLGIQKDDELAAIAFAGPIELYPYERGLRSDPDFGKENSLYMIDTTVLPTVQGMSIGKFLKYSLTLIAMEGKYQFIKGRNRDRLASHMLLINLSLGAYEQFFIKEDYPDHAPFRDVLYYKQELKWNTEEKGTLSNRINGNLTTKDLNFEFIQEQIPQLVNKVCLSNFVGHQFLNELDQISNQFPKEMRHLYTTSGQSECVDKIIKSILFKDPTSFAKDSYFLSFEGHLFGKGSNFSRSLSQHHFTSEDELYFPVQHLPHPDDKNYKTILKNLETHLKDSHLKGIWIEPVRQMDQEAVPLEFLRELKKKAQENKIPLIYNESASQQFHFSENHYFISNDEDLTPDMTMVFLGGQMGLCFLKDEYYISKPLMMISTWDGDQFALTQYMKSMNILLENKNEILGKRKEFKSKLKGRSHGLLTPPLSYSLMEKLSTFQSCFKLDPSDSEIREFLK